HPTSRAPIPLHADCQQKPPPPQQVIGRAANAARPIAARNEITQKPLDRLHRPSVRVHHLPPHHHEGGHDTPPLGQSDRADITLHTVNQHVQPPQLGCASPTDQRAPAPVQNPACRPVVRSTVWNRCAVSRMAGSSNFSGSTTVVKMTFSSGR